MRCTPRFLLLCTCTRPCIHAECMYGWMARWMDGWTDGWMYISTYIYIYRQKINKTGRSLYRRSIQCNFALSPSPVSGPPNTPKVCDLHTLGPELGIIYILGALGYRDSLSCPGLCRESGTRGLQSLVLDGLRCLRHAAAAYGDRGPREERRVPTRIPNT